MGNGSFKALISYNFFYYSLFSIISFIPIYFAGLKMDGTEIGVLMGIGPLFTVVIPPFWGFLSDKLGKLKEVLLFILIVSSVIGFILFKMNTFWAVVIMLCGFYFFFAAITPLTDSFSFQIARNMKISFGSIRLFGSIGFAIASVLLGVILTKYGIGSFSYLVLGIGLISFFCLIGVKETIKPQKAVERGKIKKEDILQLIRSGFIRTFLIMVFFIAVAHRMNDSFLSLYIKEVGGNDTAAGLAWFVAALFEAIVFMLSPIWLKKGKENQLLLFAIVTYIVRWCLLAFIHSPSLIVVMQILHSLTFAIFYLTMFQQFMKNVPSSIQSTSQTVLLSLFFGAAGLIGSVAGGPIFKYFGGEKLYLFMALLSFIGLLWQVKLMLESAKIRKRPKTNMDSKHVSVNN